VKILLAIISCERDELNGNNQSQRETWLPDAAIFGADYKFFVGKNGTQREDVEVLECDDGYFGMPDKVQAAAKWGHEHEYDFVFKIHTDTYVRPERLLRMPFQEYDYIGAFYISPHCWEGADNPDLTRTQAFGGSGYWLSRKACGYLADGKLGETAAEDCWTGLVLSEHPDIQRFDERYLVNDGWREKSNQTDGYPGPLKSNLVISTHLYAGGGNASTYDNRAMYEIHERWLTS